MAKKLTSNDGEHTETKEQRRKRRMNAKFAKEKADRYVIPCVIALIVLLVAFFFYKYGFGTKISDLS